MDKYLYVGKGIYSIPEVAKYTAIDPRKIRRWTVGYRNEIVHNSIYQNDYAVINEKVSLSFLDLIEIRFIDAFHKYGVSWKAIRIASEKAKELLGRDHPFSSRKFFTDKRSILTRIAISENENELLNLVKSQYEIDEMLKPCLYEGIDFTDLDVASRWYPLGRDYPVLIDPKYNWGRPVIANQYIDTKLIYDMYSSGKTIDEISFWYEIDGKLVSSAIDYEKKLVA